VSFELGGKSPLLVFDDSDLDLAVDLAVEQFDNSGQVCLAAVRMLVQESVYDEFRSRFLARAATIAQGDPRDGATDIGPLVSRVHAERVDGFVARAVADGARVILGGGPNHELNASTGGFYYRPTVFEGFAAGAEIVCHEVFGPVLTLQSFTTEDEGVAMANDTDYGLAATLVTGDRERAERVSARLRAGTVWVNCFFVRDLSAPFGGSGRSGIGREGGTWSFDFYCDVKNSVFAPKGWNGPALPRAHDHAPGGDPSRAQRGQGDLAGPRAAPDQGGEVRAARLRHRDRAGLALVHHDRVHHHLARPPRRPLHG
jgi:5-carboxymethyl-2-hydroxymuconic-semialdehyde dehydrogenase